MKYNVKYIGIYIKMKNNEYDIIVIERYKSNNGKRRIYSRDDRSNNL